MSMLPPAPSPSAPAPCPAAAPCPTAPPHPGPVFEEHGLRIPLQTGVVRWIGALTPGGRPICVAIMPSGRYLRYRVLEEGEDWRAVERELRADLTAAIEADATRRRTEMRVA